MGFLKFLVITLGVIWLVGLILRAAFSRFLRKGAEAYNRAAKEAEKEARRASRSKREGEVTVEKRAGAVEKRVRRDVGDYVEFEEVKDEAK
jgi:hypothetical protein